MKAPLPENEAARLEALRQCKLLDTTSEKAFDDITSLATYICGTPIALVSLIDANRQWFKSKVGIHATQTPRDIAFCTYAILQQDVLIVTDALTDSRFATNPLVTSDPHIRFYAGVPLITPEGYGLGTLCVIDYVPRKLASQQVEALRTLGRQVVKLLELRRNLGDLERTTFERKLAQKQRSAFFTRIAAGFGLASVILVLISVVSYRSLTELVETSNQAANSHKILEKLEEVFSQVKDAETGQRGYLITGEETYLEPYHTAIKVVDQLVLDLKRFTAANPNQQRRVDTLEPLIAQRLAVSKQIIDLRSYHGFDAARHVVLTGKGKHLMDDIRKLILEIENEESKLLNRASLLTEASARNTIFTFSSGIFLTFLIFVAVYYFIYREISERKLTEEALQQERDFTCAVLDTSGAMVVVFDPQGRIVRFNSACEQTTGYSFAEVKGKYFWDLFVIPEQVQPVKAVFENLTAGEFSNQHENYWVTIEGDRRLIAWSNTVLYDKVGAIEYIISTGIDITERKRADEQVNLLQTLMLAIVECGDFQEALAVVLRAVCETKGWNYGEAWIPGSDKTVLTCSWAWYSRADGRDGRTLPVIEKFRRWSEEFTFQLGIGLPGRVWSSKQPEWLQDVSVEPQITFPRADIAMQCGLRAGLGIPLIVNEQVLAVLVFFKFESSKEDMRLVESISAVAAQLGSVIQRKRMEQVLRESEERFQMFMNNSPAVAFMKDEQGRYVYVNKPFESCFNIKMADLLGKTDFDLWPAEIALQLRENDTRVLTAEKPLEILETVHTLDGPLSHWLSFKFPCFDVSGRRLLGGVALDNTERQRTESELREMSVALQQANEKLTSWVNELEQRNREIALLSEMSDVLQACLTVEEAYTVLAQLVQPLFPQTSGAIFLINASKNLVEAVATWGSSPLPSQETFTPNQCWALRRGRANWVEGAHSGLPCKHLHQDSSLAESLCVPMMAQGEALGVLYLNSLELGRLTQTKQQLASAVTENIALSLANLKLRQTLENQSIRDPLTGLFNRRYLEESLEREIPRAERKQQSLGVIMLDVDYFKRFNDSFGHEAGDAVLKELSQFLQKHVRKSDIVCRYGGEELTLILPEASLEFARQRAEQLREGVKHIQVQHRHQPLGAITVSLGVACFPEHGRTKEAVLQAADAALYRAKKEGRDAVRLAF